ncbi:cellulose synthase-like protein E6 [Rhodamnia argentea]|uniref:Cellulose synthase-like protein E6 n=1 Tax=Rhodamnia argentea TaxID=178133 RepID=A0A8B8NKW5_9MYRT|nr:cellulose synthase-like protein E6 [Rhodamnia argentea]XP_048129839.1 cellulose synthase-like protein E6 [Rhodamnia argentea]
MAVESRERGGGQGLPLFETKKLGGARIGHKVFAATILGCLGWIWVYRSLHLPRPGEKGRWAWVGMFVAEVLFGLYWVSTQSVRWNAVCQYPFKERLSQRYENDLPAVDVFVCTADPEAEPPAMVVSTVLSAMSFNYPPEKLSVYLSDDGGSALTFYALLEASKFSKRWIPFCKKFKVEPRSPGAYFARHSDVGREAAAAGEEWFATRKLYEDMKHRIEEAMERGSVPMEVKEQHEGFSEWNNPTVTKRDHQSIVKIVIDGRQGDAVDDVGCRLPTLVYLAREKRPQCPHNFKAGSMNALIRVSSVISNAPVILNLDCDMYSNNSDSIRDALCFFMDEERGHQMGFVQYPQNFDNITKNDIYFNFFRVFNEIELREMGGYEAAPYCGTGCFHRRESLCGRQYSRDREPEWSCEARTRRDETVERLEEDAKLVADCSYEKGSQWGKEMGVSYGIAAEDVVTGLRILCRGWRSVYYNPKREAFLGVAPNTLDLSLVQYKRWSEGMFQIFISRYCPLAIGHGHIPFGARLGYCIYLLWAPLSLPTLFYVAVPPVCLLRGVSLFPLVGSPWFVPFACVFLARNAYSLAEAVSCGATPRAWWNSQRMLLIRRTTAFFFAFADAVLNSLGVSQIAFDLTAKVATEDTVARYEKEIMDFSGSSMMFVSIATLALLNLFCLVGGLMKLGMDFKFTGQMVLGGLVVLLNSPVYHALFIRRDKGCFLASVVFKSFVLASVACSIGILMG